MVVPDALSRSFEAAALDDSWYAKTRREVKAKPDEFPDYRFEDDVLMRHIGRNTDITKTNWRMVVPNEKRIEILKECHDEAAHLGYAKTYARICDRYWWPKMFQDVREYVKNCEPCGLSKAPNYTMVTPMGQPRIPKLPFEMISLDFKGPFIRSTTGHQYLLVVTDQLSKFVMLYKLRKADAKTTVRILEDLFLLFGVPRIVIHDNGSVFLSKLFVDMLGKYFVTQQKTPLYHPQANPTERVNRVIGAAISAYVKENHKKWDEKLPEIGYALRTCVHESTNFTPYEAVFGMKMRIQGKEHEQNSKASTKERLDYLVNLREKVRDNMLKAHGRAKKYYDTRARERTFKVNDSVFVRNFKLSSAANQYSASTAQNWRAGIISKIVGASRYEVTATNNKIIGIFDAKDIKLK